MKAIVLPGPGARLDDVVPADLPVPEPGPGQLCLRVIAVSVNPVDWKLAIDHKPEWTYPHVLGLDAPAEELEAGFAATAGAPIVKGFAVGRTIFMNAAEGWLSGKLDDEAAIADMAKRFETLTGLWLATRGRKAA